RGRYGAGLRCGCAGRLRSADELGGGRRGLGVGGVRRGAGPREAEVLAQGRALVLGAERPALLEQRDDSVEDVVEPARREVRDEDEAVGRVLLDMAVDVVRDLLRSADEPAARRHLD